MKKNLLLILISFGITVFEQSKAQNPVPNHGFENWTNGTPDSWLANNSPGFAVPVTQVATANSGSSAAHVEVVNSAIGPFPGSLSSSDNTGHGFPVALRYGTLSFYYKLFQATASGTLHAVIAVTDSVGNGVAVGDVVIATAASSYTLAAVPINYLTTATPAEAIILFENTDQSGTAIAGNYFEVDDVSLSGITGIPENQQVTPGIEKVQPNPAEDVASIYYSMLANGDIKFELMDVTGKKYNELTIAAETAGRHKVELNVATVPAGYYILRMISATGTATAPLQIVK